MTLPYISDLRLFLALLSGAAGIVAWLGLAAFAHARRRDAMPIRVHVAGSRGKTTVTRLIGAALRAEGRRVLVKTTGTDPVLILPDGSERDWPRWGPPSISEQTRFFREAQRLKADAVVLESMAIEPEYLWASENYLVRATHTLITNARPDHAEVVGTHPLAAAHAMSLVVPNRARLLVSDEIAGGPIHARATRRKCAVTVVSTAALRHDDANRAMALALCATLGISDSTARAGFDKAGADRGTFFVARGALEGRPFRFASAFSCNDTRSLEQLWHETPSPGVPVILFNARHDRPERTRAFLACLARLAPSGEIYLSGFVPRRWTRAAGLADARVHRLATGNARRALATLAAAAPVGATIWGIGNYSRLGRDIVRLLRTETTPC
ncbi:poly-gamma-glutamate synthase PgsB [Nitratireductor sp. CAU 1489]|uniref:Poly-gamma-glutamate synthase PgsB n=1 Tax=Nitratireductor arenosus TaxID=2682096 RepID=A0A844QM62_9HYPH|nr:poly-gamma-glutamate synthase PgsB [Nitratireductor arenosus]MVA99040.1 poly-gamma-glutamate synthase PgsB [Nitratireductor arenosus]